MMPKKYWMQEAFGKNKGGLHRDLGVPLGQKIPIGRIRAAATAKGRLGHRARAALNAITSRHKDS